ncbi:MAG: exopolysaccharide biosynthesis protein [Pseudomonadota bacterium]
MADKQTRDADSIGDIVDGLEEIAQESDQISVRGVLEEFGASSFAPIMLIIALIGMLPTGGIPGVPTACAVIIVLVAGQLVWGREHIWVPGFIADRSVPSDKLSGATDKLETMASALDGIAKGRLEWLTKGPGLRLIGALICVTCCFIPPLELVPFAAAIPFATIALLSLALIVRDGLIMLIASVIAIGALGFAVIYFTG